jgi:hypothetical protein
MSNNKKFTLSKNFTYFKEVHKKNSTTLGHNFFGSTIEILPKHELYPPTKEALNLSNTKLKYQSYFSLRSLNNFNKKHNSENSKIMFYWIVLKLRNIFHPVKKYQTVKKTKKIFFKFGFFVPYIFISVSTMKNAFDLPQHTNGKSRNCSNLETIFKLHVRKSR